MNLFKTRLIFGLIGYGLLAGAGVAVVLHNFFPGLDWSWFAAILVFFMAIESLIIHLAVNGSYSKDEKRLVNIYMLTKSLKIIPSLIFILIYFLVEGTYNLKNFIVVYIIFYLLFLIAETYMLTRIEKHIKLKDNNEE